MIDVVCFCGCSYSFVGDAGACPRCGEDLILSTTFGDDAHGAGDESKLPSRPLIETAAAEELAA